MSGRIEEAKKKPRSSFNPQKTRLQRKVGTSALSRISSNLETYDKLIDSPRLCWRLGWKLRTWGYDDIDDSVMEWGGRDRRKSGTARYYRYLRRSRKWSIHQNLS